MIPLVVAAVLLLIHALVCLVLWTLMKLGLLPVRGHMLAVMVLVPLWGPLLLPSPMHITSGFPLALAVSLRNCIPVMISFS